MNTCKKCNKELKHYDGCAGYQALYCNDCGYFCDHVVEGQAAFFINLK